MSRALVLAIFVLSLGLTGCDSKPVPIEAPNKEQQKQERKIDMLSY
jgi:starvation-inducible outer membrane lipoprotein